ncbi:MAG: GDP-mannose 4,6-dehydratase, partial [Candidatus Altiarchaeota archaeon]
KLGGPDFIECDIRDASKVEELVAKVRPDVIYHMAAQSYVTVSWEEPARTLETNVMGTFNLLEAVKNLKQDPKMLVACSSAEYGITYEDEIPINEKKEFRPSTIYAVSKIGTDMLAYFYYTAYNQRIVRVRLFNTSGPAKTMDACSDFTKGVVDVEKDIRECLEVGNTNAVRDITDVRDALKALWLLTEKGADGDVYNICSGTRYTVSEIIDACVKLAKKPVSVRQDKERFRLIDDPIFVGDNSKIRKLGWKPTITLEETLESMLDYWRQK